MGLTSPVSLPAYLVFLLSQVSIVIKPNKRNKLNKPDQQFIPARLAFPAFLANIIGVIHLTYFFREILTS